MIRGRPPPRPVMQQTTNMAKAGAAPNSTHRRPKVSQSPANATTATPSAASSRKPAVGLTGAREPEKSRRASDRADVKCDQVTELGTPKWVKGPKMVQAMTSQAAIAATTRVTSTWIRYRRAAQQIPCTVAATSSSGQTQPWPANTRSSPADEASVKRPSDAVGSQSGGPSSTGRVRRASSGPPRAGPDPVAGDGRSLVVRMEPPPRRPETTYPPAPGCTGSAPEPDMTPARTSAGGPDRKPPRSRN